MNSPDTILTTQGTVEDVMAFFRRSQRTVYEWMSARPPVLGHWGKGRNICFGEEDVVRLRVKFYVAGEGLDPGEAEKRARREWRELLKVRRDDELGKQIAELERKIETLARAIATGKVPSLKAA